MGKNQSAVHSLRRADPMADSRWCSERPLPATTDIVGIKSTFGLSNTHGVEQGLLDRSSNRFSAVRLARRSQVFARSKAARPSSAAGEGIGGVDLKNSIQHATD
jgi:hypothetical protein